jgi:hypothetical protein
MNILKSFFAGLVIAAAAPVLDATIINFDDLLLNDQPIPSYPNSYSGLYWANVYVYNAANDSEHLNPSGYQYSVISSPNVAFNGGGTSIIISSNTPFTLNSAYMTSVWRDNLQMEVIGSFHGLQVYDDKFTLSATAHTLETFGLPSEPLTPVVVDSVEFIPSAGPSTTAIYSQDYGNYFAMDDVNVDLLPLSMVPEPGTWVAAALALAAIAFGQRDGLSRAKPVGR